MTDHNRECSELLSNEDTKTYFNVINGVFDKLIKVFEQSGDGESDFINNLVICPYLASLKKTMMAIHMRHYFNAQPNNRNNDRLYISIVDSGFPLEKEIRYIESGLSSLDEKLNAMSTVEELKSQILNTAISDRKIDKSLQYELSQRLFYEYIKENREDLFLSFNNPTLVDLGVKENEKHSYMVYWSTYDPVKNHPTVYVMYFYSSFSNVAEVLSSPDYKKMSDIINNNSLTSILLLNMVTNIDKNCEFIQPKKISRYHLGPIYKNGITQHNDSINDILDECNKPENNWVFCLSEECILSKGEKTEKKSLFLDSTYQIFDVDSQDTAANQSRVTSLNQMIVVP